MAPKTTGRTTPKQQRLPSLTQVKKAISANKFSKEELWEITQLCSMSMLDGDTSVIWKINVPGLAVFTEEQLTAREVREVAARTGAGIHQLTYSDLVTNGMLVYELVRARLMFSEGEDNSTIERKLDKFPFSSLLAGVDIEVVSPAPKDEGVIPLL